MTAWIIVKIAVVPPIPKANVNVAGAVNTGDLRNCLKVYRRVLRKFCIRSLTLVRSLEYSEFPEIVGGAVVLKQPVGIQYFPGAKRLQPIPSETPSLRVPCKSQIRPPERRCRQCAPTRPRLSRSPGVAIPRRSKAALVPRLGAP